MGLRDLGIGNPNGIQINHMYDSHTTYRGYSCV